jgi:hypothetical protein
MMMKSKRTRRILKCEIFMTLEGDDDKSMIVTHVVLLL